MREATEGSSSNGIGRPGLGVITFANEGGGVAYIARLLRAALADAGTIAIALGAEGAVRVPWRQAGSFTAKLTAANLLRRVDWVLFGHPGIAKAQLMVPAAIRLPFVVQLHGTESWEEGRNKAVEQATLRIAPSRHTAQRVREAFPEMGDIAVCPHGLLPDEPRDKGYPDRSLLSRIREESVLIIGRLCARERRKGHDQLLECWPRVLEAVPNAQLVIAGDGDDSPRLRSKCASLGISEQVLFCGYVSDATRDLLLRRAGLFAMPSRQEGFGLVYLEAMRAGLACVAATDDGSAEPIVQGETGFLVEREPQALAGAVTTLLMNADLRWRLGRAGKARFEWEFTFDRYRDRLLRLLMESDLVAGVRRGRVAASA